MGGNDSGWHPDPFAAGGRRHRSERLWARAADGQPPPVTAAAFAALALGNVPVPAGAGLTYVETRWSYRQPISYQIFNAAGEPLATITPANRRTRRDSVLRVGEQPVLLLAVDRAGNTAVADAAGSPLGEFRRRFALLTFRMELRTAGLPVGTLTQRRVTSAGVSGRNGGAAARIRRSRGMRFAGASVSWLYLGGPEAAVPGALLVAAVPALDAVRKAWRRSRFMSGGG